MENDIDLEFAAMTLVDDILPKEERRFKRYAEYEDAARYGGVVATVSCNAGLLLAEFQGASAEEFFVFASLSAISFAATLGGFLSRWF